MSSPIPDPTKFCHRTGFEKKCRDLVVDEKCWLWVSVVGTNPNTGETVQEYGCADAWAHLLQVQMAMTNNSVAASSDKATNELRGFRNDVRDANGLPELPTQDVKLLIEGKHGI